MDAGRFPAERRGERGLEVGAGMRAQRGGQRVGGQVPCAQPDDVDSRAGGQQVGDRSHRQPDAGAVVHRDRRPQGPGRGRGQTDVFGDVAGHPGAGEREVGVAHGMD